MKEFKTQNLFLLHLSSFTFLFISTTTSNLLNFQIHKPSLHSLPNPPKLSWPISEPNSIEPNPNSFTLSLRLHHIDSLSFNRTPQHLFDLRLQRDTTRVESLTSITQPKGSGSIIRADPTFSSSVISGISQGTGEYFTRIGVGTPPKHLYMVIDTGSDIIWLQCLPCKKCYTQSDPIFNPRKSKSYSLIPCGSSLCNRLYTPGCKNNKVCQYNVSYGDGSFTVGDFSTETLTFSRNAVSHVAIGCGHDNEGLFNGSAGLLGLGRGVLSFLIQTGNQFSYKFSYCLVDRSASAKSSSIIFGNSSETRTMWFTPILKNPKISTLYYVELLGISVGGLPVRGITPLLFQFDRKGNGGVIIDSGTAVTRLPRLAYVALRNAFRVEAGNLKRAPKSSLFDTCYNLSGVKEVKIPTMVMHFRGADVSLPAANQLIPVDNAGTFCFAFAAAMSGLSIIGNVQQQGFRVFYDLVGSRVGFLPGGCT